MAKGLHDNRYRELIAKLTDERKRLGLSQRELAERLGRHQQFVSKYEIGERRLDVVEFIDVSGALGLTVATLIQGLRPN